MLKAILAVLFFFHCAEAKASNGYDRAQSGYSNSYGTNDCSSVNGGVGNLGGSSIWANPVIAAIGVIILIFLVFVLIAQIACLASG